MAPPCSTTCRALYSRTSPANRGLSNHSWVSLISCSNDLVRALLGSYNKIDILGDPRSLSLEGLDVGPDAGSGIGEIVIVQVQVQEIGVPGHLGANLFPALPRKQCAKGWMGELCRIRVPAHRPRAGEVE